MELIGRHTTPHISFSEYQLLSSCTYRHKLQYMDKIKTPGGPALYFGSLIHKALENIVIGKEFTDEQFETELKQSTIKFAHELEKPENKIFKKIQAELKEKHIKKMLTGGKYLLEVVRNTGWQEYETIGVEIPVYEDLSDNKKFKGFIDWIYKKDGQYYIADFKTSEKGWGPYNRKDEVKRYQLLLYKWFFAQANNIPLENINVQFIILKWAGKANTIEFFNIPSSEKKIKKVVAKLEQAVVMLGQDKRAIMKNRAACRFCPFENTTYCNKND